MVFKRKFQSRRGWEKKRKLTFRPSTRFSNPESIIKMTRLVDAGFIHQTTGATLLGAAKFQLNQVPNYAEFAMFDQYRISRVAVSFIPDVTSNLNNSNTIFTLPHLVTAVDMDDASTPANEASLLSNQSFIVHTPGHRADRFFAPRTAAALYAGVAAFGYGERKGQWIDVASADVEYYGIKWMMLADNANQPDAFGYRIFVKYWLEFKKAI